MERKGQIEITFNWIYIVVAGAVILLFFVGLVVKQKAVSEQRLSQDVLRTMESILTAAAASEKTKSVIDISGLAESMLSFTCREGVTEFGIDGQEQRQDGVLPLFSLSALQGSRLYLWSIPYTLPFKTADFLLVTSDTVTYYFIGNTPFTQEFIHETEDNTTSFRINVVSLPAMEGLAAVDAPHTQIRIVDTIGTSIREGMPVPSSFLDVPDKDMTGVVFMEDDVDFYAKEGGVWKKTSLEPIPIISLGGERDAAKFAAVFAQDGEMYQCTMLKAIKRLSYLLEIYGGKELARGEISGKLGVMQAYYEGRRDLHNTPECLLHIQAMHESLQSQYNNVGACLLTLRACSTVVLSASQLRESNNALQNDDCMTLY